MSSNSSVIKFGFKDHKEFTTKKADKKHSAVCNFCTKTTRISERCGTSSAFTRHLSRAHKAKYKVGLHVIGKLLFKFNGVTHFFKVINATTRFVPSWVGLSSTNLCKVMLFSPAGSPNLHWVNFTSQSSVHVHCGFRHVLVKWTCPSLFGLGFLLYELPSQACLQSSFSSSILCTCGESF